MLSSITREVNRSPLRSGFRHTRLLSRSQCGRLILFLSSLRLSIYSHSHRQDEVSSDIIVRTVPLSKPCRQACALYRAEENLSQPGRGNVVITLTQEMRERINNALTNRTPCLLATASATGEP